VVLRNPTRRLDVLLRRAFGIRVPIFSSRKSKPSVRDITLMVGCRRDIRHKRPDLMTDLSSDQTVCVVYDRGAFGWLAWG